jgi:hypothetical protein
MWDEGCERGCGGRAEHWGLRSSNLYRATAENWKDAGYLRGLKESQMLDRHQVTAGQVEGWHSGG